MSIRSTERDRIDIRWQHSPTIREGTRARACELKGTVLTSGGSTLRRSERVQGQERVNYHECVESETRSGSDDDGSDGRPFYGLKLRAADPRYITHGDDGNRGDILLTLAQVRELIIRKLQSEEGVATCSRGCLANHSRNGVLFDIRTKRNPVSQGYKEG